MASMENTTSWKQIQQGLRETERLIGRKEYNMAMVKARQTLEFMVRCLAEKACVVEGDLSDTIDQLYEGRWISRTTKASPTTQARRERPMAPVISAAPGPAGWRK